MLTASVGLAAVVVEVAAAEYRFLFLHCFEHGESNMWSTVQRQEGS